MGAKLILRGMAIAVAAMALNIACAFLWVAIYAHLIAPGQGEAAYEAYAQRAVPWSAVIAGILALIFSSWLSLLVIVIVLAVFEIGVTLIARARPRTSEATS